MKFIRRNRFKVNKIKLLSIKITGCGRILIKNEKKNTYQGKKINTHFIHTLNARIYSKRRVVND